MPSRRSSLTLTLLLGVPLLADGWSSAALLGGAFDYVVSALVALGALIFIHELGHFMVAKAMGVGVERFSLGFGPRIFSFRRGETEYCVSIVPLGGYVKMTGEEAHGEDAIHPTTEAPPIDPAKSFSTKPLWARFLIVLRGSGDELRPGRRDLLDRVRRGRGARARPDGRPDPAGFRGGSGGAPPPGPGRGDRRSAGGALGRDRRGRAAGGGAGPSSSRSSETARART